MTDLVFFFSSNYLMGYGPYSLFIIWVVFLWGILVIHMMNAVCYGMGYAWVTENLCGHAKNELGSGHVS